MSSLGPPYLIEFRAARAIMRHGNIGPSTLQGLMQNREAFFFQDENIDFSSCRDCNQIPQVFPQSFLSREAGDLPFKSNLAAKLTQSGMLKPSKKLIAQKSLDLVAIAKREKLCCIMQENDIFWDNIAVCKAANLSVIPLSTFLAGL